MSTGNLKSAGVIVLGMSRSGTSAVAGAFRAAGFFLGADQELMEGDANNPKGYNENVRIHAVNERILHDSGGSWFDPPEPEALSARQGDVDEIRALVLGMREDAAGGPILIKDPRVGVLMPLWTAAAEDLLHPVLVVRDPLEIASSLERRDGTPGPVALAGWEVHMTRLLSALQGSPVTVVRYRDLVSDPSRAEQAVEGAAAALDPSLRARVRPERVREVLDPALWRARSTDLDHGEFLTVFQNELWTFLDAIPAGTHRLEPPARLTHVTQAARDAVASETRRIQTIQDRDWLQEHYGAVDAQLMDARIAHDLAKKAHDQLASNLDVMANSLSWRITKPLRDAGTVLRRNRRSG